MRRNALRLTAVAVLLVSGSAIAQSVRRLPGGGTLPQPVSVSRLIIAKNVNRHQFCVQNLTTSPMSAFFTTGTATVATLNSRELPVGQEWCDDGEAVYSGDVYARSLDGATVVDLRASEN